MNIYKNLLDNKLYILSEVSVKTTGRQLQCASYDILSKRQSDHWKNIPTSKQKFFIKVFN